MSQKVYKLHKGSLQEEFLASRSKIQLYGGGFANGKTATICIKTIQIAKDYPGANILMARATYPKLMDTLAKEFFKWLPQHWIKNYTKTPNPTLTLTNGTTINFRHVAQQGVNAEHTTSNLLSATYDLVVIDQIEDPEITEKDFNDILGRLRGMARYEGDDPTMPRTGPRWFLISCNPTGNWVYKKLVKPIHAFDKGLRHPDLLVDTDTGKPIVELYEGSTYENRENLESDFIRTLEAAYKGQMRDRFLLGKWASYEGLVYPQWDPSLHMLPRRVLQEYVETLYRDRRIPTFFEGYDHGIAVPGCYQIGCADHKGNMFILDGHYEQGLNIEQWAKKIGELRMRWDFPLHNDKPVYADPQIFKRTTGDKKTVGTTVADLFRDEGIAMQRGNNDIVSGITKIQGYLSPQDMHRHPIYGTYGAPYLYVNSELQYFDDEITAYYWKRNPAGEYDDKPQDKNDHAMDCKKYMLTERPTIAQLIKGRPRAPDYMKWHEYEEQQNVKSHRYG